MRIVEDLETGEITCASCDPSAFQGPANKAIYECNRCDWGFVFNPNRGECECNSLSNSVEYDPTQEEAGVCILEQDIDDIESRPYDFRPDNVVEYNAHEVTTSSQIASTKISSSAIMDFYQYNSTIGCILYENPQSC